MLFAIFKRRFVVLMAISLSVQAFIDAPQARADYASQSITLDQSNALKDGVAYGSVLIEAYDGVGLSGGGLNAGEVRLTYSAAIVADYSTLTKTFGIGGVGFNTDLALKAEQISGPAGWKLGSAKSLDGFGKFTWDFSGAAEGGTRPNPATVLITGLGADATLEHFLFGSAGAGKNPPPEGSVLFAMFVAGFETNSNDELDGHFVGGSDGDEPPPPPGGSGEVNDTPEPSALVLGGISLGCLSFYRWTSRRRRAKSEQ